MRRKSLEYIINALEIRFEALTVRELVLEMRSLGADSSSCGIDVLGNKWLNIGDLYDSIISKAHARYIACWFYGGPPKMTCLYHGNLRTLLIDRMLTSDIRHENRRPY